MKTGDSSDTHLAPFLIPKGGLVQRKRRAPGDRKAPRDRSATAVSGVEYVGELQAVARREFPLVKWLYSFQE